MKDLHTYGKALKAKWVMVHDTGKDGTSPFDANKIAKAKAATPLKRPENGLFRPARISPNSCSTRPATPMPIPRQARNMAALVECSSSRRHRPRRPRARIALVYRGKKAIRGSTISPSGPPTRWMFVEDAGDKLHSQRNALDSGYVVDLTADYSKEGTERPASSPRARFARHDRRRAFRAQRYRLPE